MEKKKETLLVTFSTTAQAMQMERFCMEQGIPGRLIPVPRKITAGCGLSWKTEPSQRESLQAAMRRGALPWEAMYVLEL